MSSPRSTPSTGSWTRWSRPWPQMTELRQALGVPFPVPPAPVTRALAAARHAVGWTHDRMGAPFQVVLERMFGIIDNKALCIAVELGVPDLLHVGPQSAAELAAATGADADALNRVLRFL